MMLERWNTSAFSVRCVTCGSYRCSVDVLVNKVGVIHKRLVIVQATCEACGFVSTQTMKVGAE